MTGRKPGRITIKKDAYRWLTRVVRSIESVAFRLEIINLACYSFTCGDGAAVRFRAMPTFDQVIRDMKALEKAAAGWLELMPELKMENGRNLSDFGNRFVQLCQEFEIKQSVVARALSVAPAAISTKYNS